MTSTKPLSRALGALALALLAGCAGRYGPQSLQAGATQADIATALGPPTGRYAVTGGERLEYARGPYGTHTFMLDLDAQGRLTGWQQVLTEAHFNGIRNGMTRDEVLMTLGHPSDARRIALQRRTLWSYRYETPFCQWFQVGLDPSGRVVDTGYGPDPRCDANFSSGGQ